jgi:hypothetical protein
MSKIFLKYHPAEIIERDPSSIFEEYRACLLCTTFLMPEFFQTQDSKLCIFCQRKTKNVKNIMLFTFKNIYFFLLKFGLDVKSLARIESKQIKNLIDNAYENFIKLDIIQKNIWNMHMENLKGKLFYRNNNNEKLIMPKFYASSPYFDSSAAKFLNRNHIFS